MSNGYTQVQGYFVAHADDILRLRRDFLDYGKTLGAACSSLDCFVPSSRFDRFPDIRQTAVNLNFPTDTVRQEFVDGYIALLRQQFPVKSGAEIESNGDALSVILSPGLRYQQLAA